MNPRQWITAGVLVLVSFGAVADDPESVIRYRQSVMKVIGGHMQAMSTMLRGNVYGENFALHADGMADISRVVASIFPAGTGEGKTEALPAIWEKPAEFKQRVDAFGSAAAALAEAAGGGDKGAIGGAMRELGGTCKGCHDDFRAE